MKETLKLRINLDYASMLFQENEGKNSGTSVKVVEISKDDPRYSLVPIIAKQIQQKYNKAFFFGWEIKRKYSDLELAKAKLLLMKIKTVFEPTGEECGTLFNETVSCEVCGANREQIGPLTLKYGSIPKKDISRTIAGEVLVSARFAEAAQKRGLKGIVLGPIISDNVRSDVFQLSASSQIDLSQNTLAGINPFDLSTSDKGEIYKCPNGHTIGLNLLSEPHVLDSQLIGENDFFMSKQKVGVKRGLLRPEAIYFCSQDFRMMVVEEKLSGFDFEIANID